MEPSFPQPRILHDTDGDGWCDLWVSLMGMKVPLTDTNADPDRDGLSNYEEMLLWRNPTLAEPLPRLLSNIETQNILFRQRLNAKKQDQQDFHQYREMMAQAEASMKAAEEKDLLYDRQIKRRKEDLEAFSEILEKKNKRELAQARARLKHPLQKDLDRAKGSLKGIDSRGRPKFHKTYNQDVAVALQVDPLWAGGSSPMPDLDGSGITVGLWDVGAAFTLHNGFGGRVTLGELESDIRAEWNVPLGESIFATHPTGVAGTLGAGLGIGLTYRGIAQGVSISSYHHVDDFSEMAQAANGGMLFSNHSYGNFAGFPDEWTWRGPSVANAEDPEFGAYTTDTKTLDTIAYLAPHYLSVWASGNEALHGLRRLEGQAVFVDGDGDGAFDDISTLTFPNNSGSYLPGATSIPFWPGGESHDPPGLSLDTIASAGCAKNHLTIGNVRDALDSNDSALPVNHPNRVALEQTSSRGPTDDGRIKPDLVANGEGVWTLDYSSTINSTSLKKRANGTSFSAPAVTGTLALLEELRRKTPGSLPLLSSTWKALLCNTAIDGITLPAYLGTAAQTTSLVGPDYFFGWGSCNALGAANLLDSNLASESGAAHLRELILFDGSTIEFPVSHDGTSNELKIMICWTDPPYQTLPVAGVDDEVTDPEIDPADDDFTQNRRRLMNDLDLVLISPDGQTTHYPWILNPADDPSNPLKKAIPGDANNTNTRDNIEQVLISAPVAGEYRVQVSHKASLKGLALLTLPDPNSVLPENADFQLLNGQSQVFSVCVSGNQEIPGLLPQLTQPIVIAGAHYFQLESDLGLHYRIERSSDLINWTELPGLLIEAQTYPHPIGPLTPPPGSGPFFYRTRALTPNNP